MQILRFVFTRYLWCSQLSVMPSKQNHYEPSGVRTLTVPQYSAIQCQTCKRKKTLKRKQNEMGEAWNKQRGAYTHIYIVLLALQYKFHGNDDEVVIFQLPLISKACIGSCNIRKLLILLFSFSTKLTYIGRVI